MLSKEMATKIVGQPDLILTPGVIGGIYNISHSSINRLPLPHVRTLGGHRRYKASEIPELVKLARLALTYNRDLELLTTRQVADQLGVGLEDVMGWIYDGSLRAIKLSTFRDYRFVDIEVRKFAKQSH